MGRHGNQHRHVVADRIRDAVGEESLQVGQQEALADETPTAKTPRRPGTVLK
jgi:hypothetical protein